jgi:hypothetical protein
MLLLPLHLLPRRHGRCNPDIATRSISATLLLAPHALQAWSLHTWDRCEIKHPLSMRRSYACSASQSTPALQATRLPCKYASVHGRWPATLLLTSKLAASSLQPYSLAPQMCYRSPVDLTNRRSHACSASRNTPVLQATSFLAGQLAVLQSTPALHATGSSASQLPVLQSTPVQPTTS